MCIFSPEKLIYMPTYNLMCFSKDDSLTKLTYHQHSSLNYSFRHAKSILLRDQTETVTFGK